MFTKTQFCKRAGISAETLRHYVDIGLLKPREIGPNGYRKYDNTNILELWFYRLGAALGNSLKEICQWNETMTLAQYHGHLLIREQSLRQQLEEIENQLAMIQEIRYYTEREMKSNQAVASEPGLEGYRVFCGEDEATAARMVEVAEIFPFASIEIDYPLAALIGAGQGNHAVNGKPRLGICVLKERWHHLNLTTHTGLEWMPARDSLCMSLITSRPLSLAAADFAPLLKAWQESGKPAEPDLICSVFCMESGSQNLSYLLKCRILLKPE